MADVIFLVVVAAFFALAVLAVAACERLMGPAAGTDGVPGEVE